MTPANEDKLAVIVLVVSLVAIGIMLAWRG